MQKYLKEDDFCECLYYKTLDNIKERVINRALRDDEKLFSKEKLERIENEGEQMMLLNSIEKIFKKYNE